MNRLPLVSFVMPVYNGGEYLSETIESILKQTFFDFELLLLNDGSTDDSLQVIKDFAAKDARVVVLDNGQNMAIEYTLNRGIAESSGVYIARMDADDVALPERLEKQVAYMELHPEISILGGQAVLSNTGERTAVETQPNKIKTLLLTSNTMLHPTIMMRKVDFVSKGLSYKKGYTPADDYKMWTVASAAGLRMANLRDVLIEYRIHETQMTNVYKESATRNITAIKEEYARLLFGEGLSTEEMKMVTSDEPNYSLSTVRGLRKKMLHSQYYHPNFAPKELEDYCKAKADFLVKKRNMSEALTFQHSVGDKVSLIFGYICRPIKKVLHLK